PLDERLVGTPLTLALDPRQYQPQITITPPGDASQAESVVDASRDAEQEETLTATLAATGASGVYTAELGTLEGEREQRRFAFNVSPSEGDLHLLDGEQLAPRLAGLQYQYHRAEDLNYDPQDVAGFNLGRSILYVLIGILIC